MSRITFIGLVLFLFGMSGNLILTAYTVTQIHVSVMRMEKTIQECAR